MSALFQSLSSRLKMLLVPILLIGLAACAQPFRADVSRFQTQLPPPHGQTFAVVADRPELAGGIEFAQYARLVDGYLANLGYAPASSPDHADLIVHFGYGVDTGRERVQSYGGHGYWGPWYGYGYPYRYGGAWGYGWYDPWFDNDVSSYTVYTSGISLKIDRRVDHQRLFEGKAEAVSTSNHLQYLVPKLIQAMFTGFPGNSGETVRISIAPEKNAPQKAY